MATTLGQHCTVFLDVDGIQRFKIVSSVDSVEAGDLPLHGAAPYTSYIFVHKIVEPTDAKADTFLRVGNVADLTTIAIGRELAVGLGQSLYLAIEFTVIYDDIATASQAKTLIQQRVDNLIADWHKYNEEFLAPLTTPPDLSTIPFPLTQSEEDERKAAYDEAHAELLAAKADSALAAVEASASISAAATCNDVASITVANSQECSKLLGQYNGIVTAEDAFRGAVTSFAPSAVTFSDASLVFFNACTAYQTASATYISYGITPTTPQRQAFMDAKLTWDNALTAWNNVRVTFNAAGLNSAIAAESINGAPAMATLQTDMSKACTTKISEVTAAASKKTECDKAAAEATTAKKAADEALSAALLADTQAYLEVKALCPEFERTVP
jgi:hypothetical protein